MKKKETRCPYCNEKLNFSQAFASKTYDRYVCTKCGKVSRVKLDPQIKNLVLILAVVVGISIIIFSTLLINYILGTVIVILQFIAFYMQVPRFIMLLKE